MGVGKHKCFIVFIVLNLLVFFQLSGEVRSVKIGVLAKRGKEKCLEKWNSTAEYLSESVDGYEFEIIPLDFRELTPAVAAKEIDFVISNPFFYVTIEKKYSASRIATLQNLRNGKSYSEFGGVIFSRADRTDLKGFESLKGTDFMAVEPFSYGGWQMAWLEFHEHGIHPKKYFKSLSFGGNHDAVVYAVLNGEVDAGTVRTDTIERMVLEGKLRFSDLRLLHEQTEHMADAFPFWLSTALYPEWPIAKLQNTSVELSEAVAIALYSMPSGSKAALDSKCGGWTIPKNYERVNRLMRELKIGPYQLFGEISVAQVYQQYRTEILLTILVMLLLSGLTIFSIRVSARLKRTNEELQDVIQQKQKLYNLGQSMAMIAHDLRSPVCAIRSSLELLKIKGELGQTEASIIAGIDQSTTDGIELITDILDYTKTMEAKIEMVMCREFADLVENDAQPMRIQYPDVEFSLEVPDNCQIYLDPLKMRRVIQNIINNAFEAIGNGEIEDPRVSVRFYKDDSHHNIVITDNGPGMSDDVKEKIFQAFLSVGKSHGSGLGLAIAKEFIEVHGGSITCESQPGNTEFHVRLPQKSADPNDHCNISG